MQQERRYLFVGFLASDETLAKAFAAETSPQISAIKFQKAIIEGLVANNISIDLVASLPIRHFPHNKLLLVRGEQFSLCDGSVAGTLMPMLNLPVVRPGLRLFLSTLNIRKVLRSAKRPDAIMVYALHTPHLLAVVLLGRLYRKPIAVFIPDVPTHMRDGGLLYALMKRIDNWVLQRLIANVDLTFPITEEIARDWLPPKVQHLVVEGIAPGKVSRAGTNGPSAAEHVPAKQCVLLYTGTFTSVAKFARLFASSPEINASLVFVGGGPDEAELLALAASDSRIMVKPFMSERGLQEEVARAKFLVNPRDTQWAGSSLSFPSKLFDYMGRGRPIISTRLASIPDKYFHCFLEVSDVSRPLFARTLTNALSASTRELDERVRIGLALLEEMSPQRVGRTIVHSVEAMHG